MKNLKLVVGHLMNDQLFVKSVKTAKHLNWLKQLYPEELVEFFAELLKLVTQISDGKKMPKNFRFFSPNGVKLRCSIQNRKF
jgi:hypothetical protein